MKMYKAEYQMREQLGAESAVLNEIESNYNEAVEKYSNLIK